MSGGEVQSALDRATVPFVWAGREPGVHSASVARRLQQTTMMPALRFVLVFMSSSPFTQSGAQSGRNRSSRSISSDLLENGQDCKPWHEIVTLRFAKRKRPEWRRKACHSGR
jgi:hypothetical protein